MLPLAARIGEAEVDVFYIFVFDLLKNCLCARHDALSASLCEFKILCLCCAAAATVRNEDALEGGV